MAGPSGFFRGIEARVLYSMPATAICWSTYEFFKYILTQRTHEEYRSTVVAAESNSSSSGSSTKSPGSGSSSTTRLVAAEKSLKSDEISTTKSSGYVIRKPTLALQTNSADAVGSSTSGTTQLLPPPQLPAISGTGVYNALSFTTVHTDGMYDRKGGRGCNT